MATARHRRRRLTVFVLTLAIVAAACGDDSGEPSTTTTSSTAPPTTTTVPSPTTSTTAPDTRALAAFDEALVEDPLYGSGQHEMTVDESGSFAFSVDPITGATPGANLLGLGTLFEIETSGIGDDLLAAIAWVQDATADAEPTPAGIVLYRQGGDGWEVVVAITDPLILGFLETTTDYQAWKPHDGTFYSRARFKTLDWDGSAAHFIADVHVLDYPANAVDSFYEVECTLNGALECVLLSDDGVLRPGDEGDAVVTLQEALIELGYLSGPADGNYGPGTESAVRNLQRDFRVTRDGRVGPLTQELIANILAGNSVLASKKGIGSVEFGTPVTTALPALTDVLGSFDYSVGWTVGPCGTWDWYQVTWGGITAIFTERDGPRLFDGWVVTDLAAVPSKIFFAGGISPSWTWSNFVAMGAGYDDGYQWWYHAGLGYGLGEFLNQPPPNPPPNNAKVKKFGTGTGAVLWDC